MSDDLDGMRAKLREMDEQRSELEDERNSLVTRASSDPELRNAIRNIDHKLDRLQQQMDLLVADIERMEG